MSSNICRNSSSGKTIPENMKDMNESVKHMLKKKHITMISCKLY